MLAVSACHSHADHLWDCADDAERNEKRVSSSNSSVKNCEEHAKQLVGLWWNGAWNDGDGDGDEEEMVMIVMAIT